MHAVMCDSEGEFNEWLISSDDGFLTMKILRGFMKFIGT